MKRMSTPAAPDDATPADEAAVRRPQALDQAGLTHLMGYAATLASVELKKSFRKHLGPLKIKAVHLDDGTVDGIVQP